MAHLEDRWRCTECRQTFRTLRDANLHALRHIAKEQWAVSDRHPGKEVACNYRGTKWALREADLSDLITERQRELAEEAERIDP